MTELNFKALNEDPDFLAPLGKNVWLMDDHRWALVAWSTGAVSDGYALIHADQHWDGCDNVEADPEWQARLLAADQASLRELVAQDELVTFDSFIAAGVWRGVVRELHLYCTENNGNDEGVFQDTLALHKVAQTIHRTPESLAAAEIRRPLIFDLCLDLFNKSDKWEEGALWRDEDVRAFLDLQKHHIAAADLVTISLSFNYSGTADDTRHLAALVVPLIMSYR